MSMTLVFEMILASVCILVMGVVDYATGYILSFFVFYYIPIALVASRHGAKAAYGLGVLCALVWFLSDYFSGHPYPSAWMALWNMAARLIAFIVVAYMVGRIRSLLASSQKEVKTLQSFLPICAKCKKIRDDKGAWQQIETYISSHTDVTFSHGYCDQCEAEMLRELEFGENVEQRDTPFRNTPAQPGGAAR